MTAANAAKGGCNPLILLGGAPEWRGIRDAKRENNHYPFNPSVQHRLYSIGWRFEAQGRPLPHLQRRAARCGSAGALDLFLLRFRCAGRVLARYDCLRRASNASKRSVYVSCPVNLAAAASAALHALSKTAK
jgi:hypothetical protein